MCGVVGIYAYRAAAPEIDCAELRTIRDYMAARGPDGAGEWHSPDRRISFGHRRPLERAGISVKLPVQAHWSRRWALTVLSQFAPDAPNMAAAA